MNLSWDYHGFTTELPRIYYGTTMVLPRIYYGITMGLLRIYYGTTIGLPRIYYETTMGLPRIYYGTITTMELLLDLLEEMDAFHHCHDGIPNACDLMSASATCSV